MFQFRLQPSLRRRALKVAARYGWSLAELVRQSLLAFIREHRG